MKEYFICKRNQETNEGEKVWDNISKLEVDCYPWNVNNYMPRTEAKLYYTDKGLIIYLTAYEKNIKICHYNMNEPVYKDSCVEFFLNPNPLKDDRYMNFEINALGRMLLCIGNSRNERKFIKVSDYGIFNIKSTVIKDNISDFKGESWSIELTIPFDFIKEIYGEINFKSGYTMKGNFYKCGDETEYPHYGCWNPIINEQPDFHRPEFFGKLILV